MGSRNSKIVSLRTGKLRSTNLVAFSPSMAACGPSELTELPPGLRAEPTSIGRPSSAEKSMSSLKAQPSARDMSATCVKMKR